MPKRKPTALDNWLAKRSYQGSSVSKNDAVPINPIETETTGSGTRPQNEQTKDASKLPQSPNLSEKLFDTIEANKIGISRRGSRKEYEDTITQNTAVLEALEGASSNSLPSVSLEGTTCNSLPSVSPDENEVRISSSPIPSTTTVTTSDSSQFYQQACHFLNISPHTWNQKLIHFQPSWFQKFPWLHFDHQLGRMLCFECVKATKLQLHGSNTIRDETFLTTGFFNSRKACEKFKKHESSSFHKASLSLITALRHDPVISQIASFVAGSQEKARTFLRTICCT